MVSPAGAMPRSNPAPDEPFGFLTDTTVYVGCTACGVACKEWNRLSADGYEFSGQSYDNTRDLGASTWRHVAFIERDQANTAPSLLEGLMMPEGGRVAWLIGCPADLREPLL